MKRSTILLGLVLALATSASAQPYQPSRVPIAFDRYYDHDELLAHVRAIAAAYPELVRLESIGKSLQGREMVVAIVNAPKTGPDTAKPAMWIDGNVHGNEIQASEAVLYTLWMLTKSYGNNVDLTKLLDQKSFYLLVSQNPDGRAYWFAHANNSSSSRSNQRPVDDDRDGVFDEDPPDDLDGDGSITQMWKADPDGRFVRDTKDPRVFRRVGDTETGEWTMLGSEGIDNDGDGDVNEDDPGGDDMNRNWPSDWQPEHVQFGAGPYPLSHPETQAVARFIAARPNIGAVQSYHNSGGMILRGPGADYLDGEYAADDRRAYDEIAKVGELLLPYYRSMVIWKDLYTVHGGFVNWTAEGLGIFSFTNEMWPAEKAFQRPLDESPAAGGPGGGGFFGGSQEQQDRMWTFRDRLQFGAVFKDYTEYQHPQYGKVLVGGLNKWSSRVTPTFMLEEECHRNFAFTMLHADHMAVLAVERSQVRRIADGLWSITTTIANEKILPSRSARAADRNIGVPDLLTCEVQGGTVVAGGTVRRFDDKAMDVVEHEPARLLVNRGIPGRGQRIFRFVVRAPEGAKATLRYTAEKAVDLESTVELRDGL
ncbi:MAG: peptidase M14 [Planctomycetes bacterium]|nr:peptidase M14 [Planctomycetota bacterium]